MSRTLAGHGPCGSSQFSRQTRSFTASFSLSSLTSLSRATGWVAVTGRTFGIFGLDRRRLGALLDRRGSKGSKRKVDRSRRAMAVTGGLPLEANC